MRHILGFVVFLSLAAVASGAVIHVPAGGNLQTAIDQRLRIDLPSMKMIQCSLQQLAQQLARQLDPARDHDAAAAAGAPADWVDGLSAEEVDRLLAEAAPQ